MQPAPTALFWVVLTFSFSELSKSETCPSLGARFSKQEEGRLIAHPASLRLIRVPSGAARLPPLCPTREGAQSLRDNHQSMR